MRFRKKPIVVEAVQWNNRQIREPAWFVEAEERGDIHLYGDLLGIKTLEGVMIAQPGDWIIRGVAGELYPCKPGIFAKTYEPVE